MSMHYATEESNQKAALLITSTLVMSKRDQKGKLDIESWSNTLDLNKSLNLLLDPFCPRFESSFKIQSWK